MNRKEILRNKYVPQHSGDYFSKPWYKRDLMHYFDYVDYQEMCKRPTNYFKDKENIKFDIIHHESRGYPLLGSYKNYSDDYFSKPWYKRDLMHYFDYVDYQEICKHPTNYFKDKKNINFDTTHNESRGDPLQDSYKDSENQGL